MRGKEDIHEWVVPPPEESHTQQGTGSTARDVAVLWLEGIEAAVFSTTEHVTRRAEQVFPKPQRKRRLRLVRGSQNRSIRKKR